MWIELKEHILSIIVCPACHGQLKLADAEYEESEIKSGELQCIDCNKSYPILNYIPRFIGDDNYARGFGFQWNRHARTQVDKFNGTSISKDRFYSHTQWQKKDLKGKLILEAGCGAGRFTQSMIEAGMEVLSIDYSNAVDACLANHGLPSNLHVFQADIYNLPFRPETFDRVFCFGVLQHTPDVAHSFACLAKMVKDQGEIAVDVYPHTFRAKLHYPRYLLRLLTRHLPAPVLYSLVTRAVSLLLPVSILLKRIPLIGRYLYPILPVANYWGDHPLDSSMVKEWAVVDTFDWLGAWYDQPQKAETLSDWFYREGFVGVEIRQLGSFVATGRKKCTEP